MYLHVRSALCMTGARHRFAGIELLLKQLADAFPNSPILHLLVAALAELVKDNDCKVSLCSETAPPQSIFSQMLGRRCHRLYSGAVLGHLNFCHVRLTGPVRMPQLLMPMFASWCCWRFAWSQS